MPRSVFGLLYAAAAVMLVDQLAELLVALHPFQMSALRWRFGAYGLLVGRTTTLVLVDVMIVLAAAALRHRLVIRTWGVVHFVTAAASLAGLALFVLDALELRRVAPPEAATTMELAAGRAVVVALAAVIYCIAAGVAALAASRPEPARRSEEAVVIVPRSRA